MANKEIFSSLIGSVTGGFSLDSFDFINIIHLYLFLILFSLPFITFMYFHQSAVLWLANIISIFVLVVFIKFLNFSLHKMYDKVQSSTSLDTSFERVSAKSKLNEKGKVNSEREEECGIELQVLSSANRTMNHSNHNSDENSCDANSAVSNEFPEQLASTAIVDVHRKNSSGSSDDSEFYQVKFNDRSKQSSNSEKNRQEHYPDHSHEVENEDEDTSNSKKNDSDVNEIKNFKKSLSVDLERYDDNNTKAISKQQSEPNNSNNNSEKLSVIKKNTSHTRRKSLKQKRSVSNVHLQLPTSMRLQRQISVDSDIVGIYGAFTRNSGNMHAAPIMSRFYHRFNETFIHFPSSPRDIYIPNSNSNSDLNLENSTEETSESFITNSAFQLIGDRASEQNLVQKLSKQSMPMRRDSNSTMSALQLPTMSAMPSSSTYSSSSRKRRNSNNTGQASFTSSLSMRRIKSDALETNVISSYNVETHPNSIEVIDGISVRNPSGSILPPPSLTLSRNAPQNLYPNSFQVQSKITLNRGGTKTQVDDNDKTRQLQSNDEASIQDSLEKVVKKSESSSLNIACDDIEDATSNDEDSGLDQEIVVMSDFEEDQNRNGSRSPLLEQPNRNNQLSSKRDSSLNFNNEEEKLVEKDNNTSELSNNTKTDCCKNSLFLDNLNETSDENLKTQTHVEKNLGAKPKQHMQGQRHDILMRKFSMGDEHYPRVYQRKLSQRSTSERIPEDNVIHGAGDVQFCRCLPTNCSQNDCASTSTFYTQQSSCLRKGSNQKNLTTFSPVPPVSDSNEVTNRRLRFARRSDVEFSLKPNDDFHSSETTKDFSLSFDETSGRSSINSSSARTSGNQNKALTDKNDFNCFVDEQGRWINVVSECKNHQARPPIRGEESQLNLHQHHQHQQISNNLNLSPYLRILTTAPSAEYSLSSVQSIDIAQKNIFNELNTGSKVYKYSVSLFKKRWRKSFKIRMSRLQLLSLFDRDQYIYQLILAVFLSTLVSILSSWVLYHSFYHDILAFFFCFTTAGSQYSLLKSIQPDSSSPIHGFNKTVTYSRPIYFCVLTSLMLLFHYSAESLNVSTETENITEIFGINIYWHSLFSTVSNFLQSMILALPLLFTAGLFPQINTCLMYLIEQIDMNIFGGNAVCNLSYAILALMRSLFACLVLTSLLYGGLMESKNTQHVLISMFIGLLTCVAYHLSRTSCDFTYHLQLVKSNFLLHNDDDNVDTESGSTKTENNEYSPKKESDKENASLLSLEDPLPKKIQSTVHARLKNDLIICTIIGLFYSALHSSTIFKVLQPNLAYILQCIALVIGFFNHYFLPQLRKHLPFLCLASPVLRSNEFGQFEVSQPTKIRWFEILHVYLSFIERNILFPLIFITAITSDSTKIVDKYGYMVGSLLIAMSSLKALRMAYSDVSSQYILLLFSLLLFNFDYVNASETFLLDYFLVSILYRKISDLLLKLQFVVTYIAPWQITWGSAFHAFAQPFSVPHSAMLFTQTILSSIFSTPLNPFLGSAIFITSYARPLKYWERDYNTLRIDNSNTRLISQLERDLGADDNNLNSIFYEHLTRSLQHSLCGDLIMGRWGNVSQGDCFVLASDYLNCLIHIVELGNGLCTFQMRGLEFRGTYCQQREVEAISEGVEDNDGCCCCSLGHFNNMLSMNAMFSTRWLAWQVVAAQYILEGYSISDNAAVATLQVFEFRKVLISYYVKSIIYYVMKSPKLQQWLDSTEIRDALEPTLDRQFVDLDPIFNHNLDDDYDFRVAGISRSSFWRAYGNWIQHCVEKSRESRNEEIIKNEQPKKDNERENSNSKEPKITFAIDSTKDSVLVSLCLSLTLLARRTLATASHSASSLGVEFFLHGLHSLFKGDFRITSTRDEWVFIDMDLLHNIVAPAIKMSLKLHQDHFLSPEEYDDYNALYTSIEMNSKNFVISHEADPLWRNSVLRGSPNLLALRHVMEDGSDEYRVIRLTKRFLNFRVIKLNRECVRGLWSGQQQELIFFRNRNPERGSIQNAKQALRNIINSSCDIPIGYPIYVSPLTTSYADTNEQLNDIIGGAVTSEKIQSHIQNSWKRIRKRFREGCSSGIEAEISNAGGSCYGNLQTLATSNNISQNLGSLTYGSMSLSGNTREGSGIRGSLVSINKPISSTLLAGFLNRERTEESALKDKNSSGRRSQNPANAANCASGRIKKESSSKESSSNSTTALVAPSASTAQVFEESTNFTQLQRKKSIESTNDDQSENKTESAKETNASDDSLCVDDAKQLFQTHTVGVNVNKRVVIIDKSQVYDCLDDQRVDVVESTELFHRIGIRSSWKKADFCEEGMIGLVVGCLSPLHASTSENQNILLVKIDDLCIAIAERGVREFQVMEKDTMKPNPNH